MRSACDLCRLRKVPQSFHITQSTHPHIELFYKVLTAYSAAFRSAVIEPTRRVRHANWPACPVFSPHSRCRTGRSFGSKADHWSYSYYTFLLIGPSRELADSQTRVQLEEALAAVQRSTQSTPGGKDESSAASFRSTVSPVPQNLAPQDSPAISLVTDTHCLDTALASFRWHIAYCGLGNPLSTTRAAFYSNIFQRTGSTFDLDDFLNELRQPFIAQGLNSVRRSASIKWPSTSLVQQCVTYYTKAGLYSLFPFADAEALQVLVKADVLNHPRTSRAAYRACLAAFAANITQMHRHDPMFRDADPDAYAHAALSLVPGIITEPIDTRTVEAIMMIVRSWILRSLAFIDEYRFHTS